MKQTLQIISKIIILYIYGTRVLGKLENKYDATALIITFNDCLYTYRET